MNYYDETILALQAGGFILTETQVEALYGRTTQDFMTGAIKQAGQVGSIFTAKWDCGEDVVTVVSEQRYGSARSLRGWRLYRNGAFVASGREHRKLARSIKAKAAA